MPDTVTRPPAALVVLLVVGGLIAPVLYQQRRAPSQLPGAPLAAQTWPAGPAAAAPGQHWFAGEGYITPGRWPGGQLDPGAARRTTDLYVFNPGTAMAHVGVTVFQAAVEPRTFRLDVAPDTLAVTDLATRREVRPHAVFWIVVDADRPVLPQLARSDYLPWDPVPETLEMPLPQRGPADGTFTDWVFPDGFQGGADSWTEAETISLLNPGRQLGRATLTFHFRDGRRPRAHAVRLPAGRVTTLDLAHLFRSANPARPPAISGDYATRVVSDVPVVSQQTRRAYARGSMFPLGSKTGAPIRSAESRLAREWYYGGGWIRPLGVLPRDGFDHTWQLLFSTSVDRTGAGARLQVYPNQATADAQPLTLPPDRADLQWLHEDAWRGRLGVDTPWGLRLTSESPVAATVTAAEYGPWSQGLPGAMSATPLVPGPLSTEWWMGIARHGGTDTEPVEWRAAWQFFNPGQSAVRVTVRFHGIRPAPERTVVVAPGTVLRLSGDEVPGLPTGRPLMVSAVGDGPFLGHVWVRVGARGVPITRALTSSVGLPIGLHGDARTAAGAP